MKASHFRLKCKKYASNNKKYLKAARGEISERNCRMLGLMSWLYLAVLVLSFVLFYFCFGRKDRIIVIFSSMSAVQLVFSLYAAFILKKHRRSYNLVMCSCLFFGACIMALGFLLCFP